MPSDPQEVLTRPAPPPDLTVRYGESSEHVIDIRLPAGSEGPGGSGHTPAPVLVMLHGGFWRAKYDRVHTGPMTSDLAAHGYVVATPEYRRTGQPGGGWPGTLYDVLTALDALPRLLQLAVPGRADLDRIALLGHSAGGHLALWAAAAHRSGDGWGDGWAEAQWRRVTDEPGYLGVVALAPVADLAAAARDRLDHGAVFDLLGGSEDSVPRRYEVADPIRLVPTGVRTVLIHGDLDREVPIGQSRSYAAAARSAGDQVLLVELPGHEHYALIDPLSTAWPHVVSAVDAIVAGRDLLPPP